MLTTRVARFQLPDHLPAGVAHADLVAVGDAMSRAGEGALRAQHWGTRKELIAPWQGKEALPAFASGAHTLEDCSLVIRGEKVLFDAHRGDTLLAQSFTKEPGTELLGPPRDKQGWYKPGTYALPGDAKLVIGARNDVKLDVTRMIDRELDRVMEELPKRGFDLNKLTGLMSLPRTSYHLITSPPSRAPGRRHRAGARPRVGVAGAALPLPAGVATRRRSVRHTRPTKLVHMSACKWVTCAA